MNWLQIGCPHCPSEINVPASMADAELSCDCCGKSYLVPIPRSPVLAAAGPLEPVAILRTPGLAGNTATGISPVPKLPAPVADPTAPAAPRLPPKLRGDVRFPWEMSPEARASAAAIFGAESEPAAEDELEEVKRRVRREQLRTYGRWMIVGLGMLAMIALAAFFIQRRPSRE